MTYEINSGKSEIRNHLFWCCSQWLDWYNVSNC